MNTSLNISQFESRSLRMNLRTNNFNQQVLASTNEVYTDNCGGLCGIVVENSSCINATPDPNNPLGSPTWLCSGGTCRVSEINNQLKEYSLKSNSLIEELIPLDLDVAYKFRDSFLRKTEKGRFYIDAYYKISKVSSVFELLEPTDMIENYKFAKNIYKSAQILQNGANNEVPLTEGLQKNILSMIEVYKKIIPENAEYQNILKTIESDVHKFSGKTRHQILSEIK